MTKINIENQINALYQKASERKKEGNETPSSEPATIGNALKETLQNMQEISNEVDSALKALSSSNTEELSEELAQVGVMQTRIMEAQHNLVALYKKLKTNKS
ncbi:hypothetical protein WDW89_01220 [Deltaproteobacteria bacterium TL4]